MTHDDIHFIDTSNYEFLDFGCSAGGSLEQYGKIFQADGKGVGLDIDPIKVQSARDKGLNAEVCNIINCQISSVVKFCVMHHFLEHIPSIHDVAKIIRNACSLASDFVLIRQPYFDADPYLFSQGFKFYWSDWRGHPNNMSLLEFHNILMPMISEGLINRFRLYGLYPVYSSEDTSIHNLDSKIDQHQWEVEKHTPKSIVNFTVPLFREAMVIVDLRGNFLEDVELVIKPSVTFFDSEDGIF